MNQNLTILASLVPGFPLLGFLLNGLFGCKLSEKTSGWLGSLMPLLSFIVSVVLFAQVSRDGSIEVTLFDWFQAGSWDIRFAFLIDPLAVMMMMIIAGVGFLIHLYSIGYMHGDKAFYRFFSHLNLFVFFMMLLVMGNSYLIMFIGWEGVGACSYLLIGFWFKNTDYNLAAKKAFVMNRIGDVGFVLAMFFLLSMSGTLEFGALNAWLKSNASADVGMLTAVTLLFFFAATGKSAQIPLYTWLPDAMAGPTPVSALIHAATMVTAGIYMIIRSSALFMLTPLTMTVILWVGTITCALAAVIGIKQNDIKKVLAYSTVSQLGLLFAALGVGAFSSAFFHLTTHAFFKALLFLGAGSVIHALGGEQDIRKMGGLRKHIKWTYITFLLGTLAISGIPPFSGFFSKDEILSRVFSHSPTVWFILQASSLITVFYMFRLLYLVFFNDFRGSDRVREHIHESPPVITIPLVILATLAAAAGLLGLPSLLGKNWIEGWLQPVINNADGEQASHQLEIILMAIAAGGAALTILFARSLYIAKKQLPEESEKEMSGISLLAYNKFYADEFYDALVKRPINQLSSAAYRFIDRGLLDGMVSGAGNLSVLMAGILRRTQQGNAGLYIFAMAIGVIALLMIQWLTR